MRRTPQEQDTAPNDPPKHKAGTVAEDVIRRSRERRSGERRHHTGEVRGAPAPFQGVTL